MPELLAKAGFVTKVSDFGENVALDDGFPSSLS
jgi:hypothetical protein